MKKRIVTVITSSDYDYVLLVTSIVSGLAVGWSIVRTGTFALVIWLLLRPPKSAKLVGAALTALFIAFSAAMLRQSEQGETALLVCYLLLLVAGINEMSSRWKK